MRMEKVSKGKNMATKRKKTATKKTASRPRSTSVARGTASPKRRRKYSGGGTTIGKQATALLAAVGGAVVGSMIFSKIPIADPRIKAGLQAAAGVGGAMVPAVRRSPILQGVAFGVAIHGAMKLVNSVAPQLNLMAGEDQIAYAGGYTPEQNLLGESSIQEIMGEDTYAGEDFAGEDLMGEDLMGLEQDL